MPSGRAHSASRSGGFSLVEALTSLALLAISMMGIVSMQSAALRASVNNQNLLLAEQVGEWAIEWVRTLTDEELSSASDMFPTVGANSVTGLDSDFQFTGLPSSATPTGMGTPDYTRYVGYRLRSAQDPNKEQMEHLFVIRLMVEEDYRSTLSRCAATVYWVQDSSLQSLDIVFFVDRKT